MRPGQDRLFKSHWRTDLIGNLATPARNFVRISQVPVAINHEQRTGKFVADWITCVDAHHQIWREIGSPGSRVRQIVLSVKTVVTDQTSEYSALHRQAVADRRQIR